jgi:hypothetical protein
MDNLKKFLATNWGAVVVFIVLIYLMTFMVYYFYSPGPQERNGLIGGNLVVGSQQQAATVGTQQK